MADYTLNIIINGDASGLDAAVSGLDNLATATQTMGASATNAASQSGNFFSGLLGNLANIKAGIDMFAGLGGAVIGVGQSLIAGSAEFEGYEARFASLMGSTDAAKDKIQELSTFASTTPFELPDVIKASQSLQVFGGSALNTKENLAVVGNAAAATGQNIGDVSFWFARAYSAIQNGQPFGEAAQNLQQMGVMSGDTVVKLNALKESGASNQQVWESFAGSLNAPTDAMTKMGGTWTGLTSTMSDSWSLLVRTFGQPLFDELKPQLQGVIDQMSSSGLIDAVGQLGTAFASVLAPAISFVAGTVIPGVVAAIQFIAPAVSEAINILSQVGAIFGELAGQAMGWGQNIISQLAGGMMDAAAAVMSVLHSIGGMIADLLMPGSPPKLLPELDTWGAGAMSAYLEGWGQADFGVFNSISDSIKGALDGIAKASGDKGMNIASIMLGSQDDIAKAINEVHQFGKVSEETFNGLISAIGPAGPEVSGLVSAYLDLQAATQNVASAQQELNSVTDEYAAKLSPLNAQLKGIQNQKQAIQDQKKLADLQTKLADQSLSDADRQMAMLEQQEIMTRQQIRTTEADRDAAVGASKAKLDAAKQEQAAAQARVNQQKALVDAQNKTNALIAEQTKAMAGAAGAMKGAASAAAPLAEAVQGVNNVLTTGRQVVGGARDSIEAIGSSFVNVRTALEPIGAFISANMSTLTGALSGIGVALGGLFATLVAGPAIWAALGTAISAVGVVIGAILSPIGLLLIASAAIGAAISTNFMGLGTAVSGILPILSQFGTVISTAFAAFQSGGLSAAFATLSTGLAGVGAQLLAWGAQLGTVLLAIGQAIATQVLAWGAAFVSWITPYIPIALGYLATWATSIYSWVVTQAPQLLAQFLTWGQSLVGWIAPYAETAILQLSQWVFGLWTWVAAQAPIWVAQLMAWGQALVEWIAPAIPLVLVALTGLGASIYAWISTQAAALAAAFTPWANSLIAWIPGATVAFLGAWPGMLGSFLDWIAGAVGPILAQLGTWAIAFVQWILPAIPPFLAGLGAVLGALVVFIAETAAVIISKVAVWGVAFLGWITGNVLPALPGLLATILNGILSFIAGAVAGIAVGLAGWGLAFLSWAKDIVPKIPGMLGSILGSIVSWILGPANTSILNSALSIGKSLVDGFVKGIVGGVGAVIDAAKNLAQSAYKAAMGALQSHSPSRLFAQVGGTVPAGLDQGITAGMPKVTTNLVNGIANLAGKAATAIEAGTKAMGAAASYSGSGGTGLSGFLAGFADLATQFNDTAVALGGRILGTATRFADTIGKVTAPIDTALKALGGLVDFVAPARANVSAFIASMYILLNALNNMAAMFDAKAIKAASVFAEGAGKMLGAVSPAIDALKKLPELVVPAQSQINLFGEAFYRIVNELLNVAALFESRSLQAGAAFGEASAKLLGVVAPAIDALKKLPELVVPADSALAVFGDALGRVVQTLIQVSSLFEQDAVDAAAKFSEGAGKAIGILKAGVDGLNALVEFVAPAEANVSAFFRSLADLLEKMGVWAGNFEVDMLDVAGAFSAGVQKSVVGIGSAVDALSKLVEFVAPAEANVSAFFRSLADLLEKMGSWAGNFEADMLAATATFAEGIQKSVAGIGAAADALGKLVEFVAPAQKNVSAFFLALADLLEKMGSWAGNFDADMLAVTAAFATAINQSVAPLKGAIESLGKFSDFVPPAQKGISAFFAALAVVLQQIGQVSAVFGAEAVATAATFATNVATVVGQLKGALQAFASLGDTSVKASVLGAFLQAAQSLIAQMVAYLPPNAEVIGSNTIVGLINGIYSQRSNLIAAMTNTVLAAVQAAQATLGIASPSKVFEQIGQYTGQGMAGGMRTMQPAVASAGAGLGISAVNATTSALRPSGGGTTNNNQRNITVNVTVGKDAGSNPYATADAVVTEINRRLGMQGT